MDDITRRAEAARAKILASGNPDLINRLHLIEATQARRPAADGASAPAATAPRAGGGMGMGGLLATGAAVAGGAWLGTTLAAAAIGPEFEQAFADIAAELGMDAPGDITGATGPDGVVVQAAADDSGGFLDDLGLGDLDLGLGDIFDI